MTRKTRRDAEKLHRELGRRERQILDILYRLGTASAAQVMEHLPEPPGYAAVRKWLSLMEEKGLVRHRQEGKRYLYRATVPREDARDAAVSHLVKTFFGGSRLKAAVELLSDDQSQMSDRERSLLEELIEATARKGN